MWCADWMFAWRTHGRYCSSSARISGTAIASNSRLLADVAGGFEAPTGLPERPGGQRHILILRASVKCLRQYARSILSARTFPPVEGACTNLPSPR